jgi:Leucine-rich repeat (LRR) protein
MKKNLQITKKNIELTLSNKKENCNLVDDSWIDRLLEWENNKNISYFSSINKGKVLNLTQLFLTGYELTELPKEIGNLTNLTELYLNFNNLTELPKEIGNLTNLTKLSLDFNHLTEIPKEIINLSTLTTLTLKSNPNLILTTEQKKWILNLKKNGCNISYDDLLDRNLPIIKKSIIDDALKYKRDRNINFSDISTLCNSKFKGVELFNENLYEILRHIGYVEHYSTTPTEEGKKRFLVSKKHAYGYMSLIRKEFAGELLVEVEDFVNANEEFNGDLGYPFQPWKRIDLNSITV